ncbi:hypothetical protein RN001_010192 [Aquatica leii]|uniref:DDE Tnp4 domain-containing protein n=1 Tax=Aquatica leii TaxID=1421715 RepID=A0AAN7P9M1_9COLE|nr:hypothetical protein RN001_010192 [Aquatica leii]
MLIQVVVDEAKQHNNVIPENRLVPVYNQGYIEIVSNYSLSEFKSHFRMSRRAMEELCTLVAPYLQEQHLRINLETKVCFFVWLLAKQESFHAVSDRFGFNKGTGNYIFKKILSSISQLKDEYIKWPTPAECVQIAARIENRLAGAIDGTHIKQTKNNAIDFSNRKGQKSMILQGVCDDMRVFTDVFIGMSSRLHDARVFSNSPLFNKLVNDPILLPPHQHLLGDAAYALLQCLLKPYRDNGYLNAQQVRFNQVMSGQRYEIAFGLLKDIFCRRVQSMNTARAQKLNKFIVTDYFEKLKNVLLDLDLIDKSKRIYNVDEIGCRLTFHNQ